MDRDSIKIFIFSFKLTICFRSKLNSQAPCLHDEIILIFLSLKRGWIKYVILKTLKKINQNNLYI